MGSVVMANRLERFLQRHGPGGAGQRRHATLTERGYVLLGRSLCACIDDCRDAAGQALTDEIMLRHMPGWERTVKHARQWFSLWKLEQGTDESN